jgi:hypothetical protein
VSHVFETRCISATLDDPRGVARVACIGDSMMFGAGGQSGDALPSQLNRILNQAYLDSLVFVDNFGETSGNVWDAWPVFKFRAQRKRFDAVVFSVCQNDLDLLGTHQVPYGAEQLANFAEGAPQWLAGVELFRDVANWRDACGIDVLVIFYSYHPMDRLKVERLEPLVASLNLPFIDMLSYYSKETALTTETYRVSEFDGHPSPMGHELAARRVAREFRAQRFLNRAPALGGDIGVGVADAVRSMIDQGVSADAALYWAWEVSGAKKAGAQRRAAAAPSLVEDGGKWETMEELAKRELTSWRRWQRRRVRSSAIERDWDALEGYFNNLFAYRRRLQAAVFLLTHSGARDDLTAQVDLLPESAFRQGGVGGQAVEFDGDLLALTSHWRLRMDQALVAMGVARAEGAGTEVVAPAFLPARTGDPKSREIGVEAIIAEELGVIDRQIALLEDYAAQRPRIAPSEPEHRLILALLVDLKSMFVYIDRFIPLLEAKVPLGAPDGPPWTVVEVLIDGAVGAEVKDKTFDLIVELTYVEPRRGIIRDRQLAGAVKERGAHRFEFPLMLQGSIRVRVPERGVNRELFTAGLARFSAIKVGNADWDMNIPQGAKLVEWAPSAEPCAEVHLRDVVLS